MRNTLIIAALLASTTSAQDFNVSVPEELVTTIGELLPERSNAGAAFIAPEFASSLYVQETCTVKVTFLWEGAGYRNSLGYFTYTGDSLGNGNGNGNGGADSYVITSSEILIPDASFYTAEGVDTGDTYTLRDGDGNTRVFEAGTRIGFFVIADGWRKEPAVRSWDSDDPVAPELSWNKNKNIGRGCYTSLEEINPEWHHGGSEFARHVAMIHVPGIQGFNAGEDIVLVGFEDLNRIHGSDDDFNDLVFTVASTPSTAIISNDMFTFYPEDQDEDGITGSDDHFPYDPERAFRTRFPSSGSKMVGVEDLYPAIGDADYNDVVIAYEFELATNAEGAVKDIMGTLHLVARGAGYNHRVGVHIPGMPVDATGTLSMERVLSDGSVTQFDVPLASYMTTGSLRVDDLFPWTRDALPPETGSYFTNTNSRDLVTPSAGVRFKITLDEPVSAELLGPPPFDLYVAVRYINGDEYDIHFPGFPGFSDRPEHLPEESGASSFLDDNGRPWMLEIPADWQFPLEKVKIWSVYDRFDPWSASGGELAADWYTTPSDDPATCSLPLETYVTARTWSMDL